MWIIQEIQVSDHALVRWGEIETHWVLVHNAARFCAVNGLLERPGLEQTGWISYLSPFVDTGQTSLTTFLTITMTKAHKCADARDRIFALIGVSSSISDSAEAGEVNTSADYTLTWDEIFRDTIRAICRQSRRLEILSAFQHEPIPPSGALPSWVGKREFDPVFVDFTNGPQVACGETMPDLADAEDQSLLIAQGSFSTRYLQQMNPSRCHRWH